MKITAADDDQVFQRFETRPVTTEQQRAEWGEIRTTEEQRSDWSAAAVQYRGLVEELLSILPDNADRADAFDHLEQSFRSAQASIMRP